MKIITMTALALALATGAFATEKPGNGNGNGAGGAGGNATAVAGGGHATAHGGNASAGAAAISGSKATSGSISGASNTTNVGVSTSTQQGQGQGQRQGQSATGGNVTYNEAAQPRNTRTTVRTEGDIRNTPDLVLGSVNPTAPCVVGGGIGLSIPGFGGGVQTGITDKECRKLNVAAMLANLGAQDAAIAYLAQNDDKMWRALEATGYVSSPAASRSAPVCRVGDRPNVVVTNYAVQMDCARELGLAR